ncbi:helix-hairpin-helix domain-containing protein [candidate division WOR-3 bacterium]|nr:helix-hairpin-helix domain-containing protein [candidate division WOR-3 bacterium]
MALVLLFLLGQFGAGLFPESPVTEADAAMQEQVERLLERRIDVNRTSARGLLAIPWLSPFLASSIIAVRDSLGGFVEVRQLQHVPGMTASTLEAIRPFLRVGSTQRPWTGRIVSRAGIDSVGAGATGTRLLNRIELQSGHARVAALTEKDRGEASAVDFLSAGAELDLGRARAVLGDFTAGFGQGLVFSAPYWRSSLQGSADWSGRNARLVTSATEASYLRGGAVEVRTGGWRACGLGSYAGRDARLGDDGTVQRLVGTGVHDDSTSLAGRNAVRELTAGLGGGYRADRYEVGFAAGYSNYSRTFAPSDSVTSFAGNELFAAGLNAQYRLGQYELGGEVAASSGSGLAGAFEMIGGWPNFDARVALRGRQARFFSPHGRWSSLTGTKDRLDASGRLAWHHLGSSVSVSGNTFRDFELDSVPARLELRLGQELGRFDLALGLGIRYEANEQRRRTAKAEVGFRVAPTTTARLVVADVYPEKGTSRGSMAACRLEHELGPAELGVTAARIDVSGTGVTMYLREPGAGRIGSSFSSSASCWRVAAGCGLRVLKWFRFGLKAGCAWKPRPVFDCSAQLEVQS